jgi:hypothetical protein
MIIMIVYMYISVHCEASEGVCVVYPDTGSISASEYIHNALYNVVKNNTKNNTGMIVKMFVLLKRFIFL